ncbi:DUF4123 domain-containing protein [Pseudomonas sp. NPDC089569]|uniref:DUF4123 domain-containing protein n=1 Tax=Pseudomonas sp. NPDC089569 TaxID=3390722 RepID=UPI003D03CAF0
MMTLHAADGGPQWLLLDVPGTPSAGVILQQDYARVRSFRLFEGTEWHGVREQGPILIDLRSCQALAQACRRDASLWPGLLLTSEASAPTLLDHLRRMLTVSVGLHHRALLGFYNPHTASYFFDACDAGELSRWLGPINRVQWFGGTWADRGIGSQGWQQLSNPGLAVSPLEIEENLTRRQHEKLHTCLLEQHAWQWSRSTATDYASLWCYLQEGLTLGFHERAVLDGWLWLRLQHPDAVPVPPLSGRTPQERLDNLRSRWQSGCP